MEGKRDGAEKQIQISLSHMKSFGHAQQIHAYSSNHDTDPHSPSHLLLHKDSQDRHNDNVKGRNKACLSHSGVHNPQLLERTACKQGDSAADAACDPDPVAVFLLLSFFTNTIGCFAVAYSF